MSNGVMLNTIIIYCPYCGTKNEVNNDYTDDVNVYMGIIYCSQCGQTI